MFQKLEVLLREDCLEVLTEHKLCKLNFTSLVLIFIYKNLYLNYL